MARAAMLLAAAALMATVSVKVAHAQRAPVERAVLAISWQPAFCETRPGLPECRSQRAGRADADQFSLHGLWPQGEGRGRRARRNFCGADRATMAAVRGGWRNLPRLGLDRALAQRLAESMPGTRSYLHRYQWVKHGTCYRSADTPAEYYRDALALLDAVNASSVRDLFADNIGREVTANGIRAAFDRSFGRGAGRRVRVHCRRDGDRQVIVELTLSLEGAIGQEAGRKRGLANLLRAARPVRAGSRRGTVDPVGLQ